MPKLSPLGVMVPSDLNDLEAAGFADGEFIKRDGSAFVGEALSIPTTLEDLTAAFAAGYAKWNGTAFVRADAVEHALQMPNPEWQDASFVALDLASGDNTISPTIPAGFKMWIPIYSPLSPANSVTYFLYLRRGGINHLVITSTIAPAAGGSVGGFPLTLYPGDEIVINCSAVGFVFVARAFLVPDSAPLKPIAFPLSSGNNLVYTCPALKKAFIGTLLGFSSGAQGNYVVGNNSTASRTVDTHIVPAAASPTTANRILTRTILNNSFSSVAIVAVLNAGEQLMLVSNGGGAHIALLSAYELDA